MRGAAFLLLVFVPRLALAEAAPLIPVPPGDDRITAVKEGQPAPYSGQLFDPPTALRWANYLQQCRYRLVADVELQKKLGEAEVKLLGTDLDLERKKYDVVSKDLQVRLAKAQNEIANPPFYRQLWFGITIGVVGAVGVMAATAALVNASK